MKENKTMKHVFVPLASFQLGNHTMRQLDGMICVTLTFKASDGARAVLREAGLPEDLLDASEAVSGNELIGHLKDMKRWRKEGGLAGYIMDMRIGTALFDAAAQDGAAEIESAWHAEIGK